MRRIMKSMKFIFIDYLVGAGKQPATGLPEREEEGG